MEFIFDRPTKHQKYHLSSFQANIISPGSNRQKLHVDTPCPEPLPEWPIKAYIIWFLDDFTNENGATEFIPGSHLWGHIPHRNRKPISLPSKLRTYKINVNEGDIIFFHSLLLHKSTPVSSNTYDARMAMITHIRNF